jgi:hypothetical protein
MEFARLQSCESIINGPPEEDGSREALRIHLGSFNYDSSNQFPKEYLNAFKDLVFGKYHFLKKFDSWESYQVMYKQD